MATSDEPKKRGPKGGIKHQPGRGHDRKSDPIKTRRFQKRAERRRRLLEEEAKRQWELYDNLTDEQRHLMELQEPKMPRPKND